MSLQDFVDAAEGTDIVITDYDDYNKQLAEQIDDLIINDRWLSNLKQPYYVVEVVERTLTKLSQTGNSRPHIEVVRGYRTKSQSELFNEANVQDKQTIQAACHTRLFNGYETPPKNHRGERQWHDLFDSLIQELHRKRE